ncbi:hypothetical protein NLG97_g875 [Lecanicillium saksenae]|uniref:Uncharacterized protein n=1 Tax=Lecanicillium saksenae TaxID=468837 RepID=A0ACC1R6R5_9HYPO|nr:hypothetical protein NLG97_g875 [Lecanicillium saksenae]
MKFFSHIIVFALGATASAENVQKRDASLFLDSLSGATADFIAADNAIVGIVSQLGTLRHFLQDKTHLMANATNLSENDSATVMASLNPITTSVRTTMDHFGQRRDVILQSSDCKAIQSELVLTAVWGSLFFNILAEKVVPAVQGFAKLLAKDMQTRMTTQADAFKCS